MGIREKRGFESERDEKKSYITKMGQGRFRLYSSPLFLDFIFNQSVQGHSGYGENWGKKIDLGPVWEVTLSKWTLI